MEYPNVWPSKQGTSWGAISWFPKRSTSLARDLLQLHDLSLTWDGIFMDFSGSSKAWKTKVRMVWFLLGGFHKWWYPQMVGLFDGKTIYKWLIWGYPYFMKPSYIYIYNVVYKWWVPAVHGLWVIQNKYFILYRGVLIPRKHQPAQPFWNTSPEYYIKFARTVRSQQNRQAPYNWFQTK